MNIKEYRILLVDDEKEIITHIKQELLREGFYRTISASTVKEAKTLFMSERPQLLVLDIMLPDGDGYEILQFARRHVDVPVIFLTAKDEDVDKLVGLGLGADDYITKPFLMKELIYRISAILRRAYQFDHQRDFSFQLGEVEIDFSQNFIIKDSQSIGMTATERAILKKLYENKNRVVTKDAIAQTIWGEEMDGNEQSLIMHIRRIRKKIEVHPSEPQHLITIKGIGYKLKV